MHTTNLTSGKGPFYPTLPYPIPCQQDFEDDDRVTCRGCRLVKKVQQSELVDLNEHNKEFTAIDPIVEKMETRLDWSASDHKWDWKTSTDVAEMVGVFNPSKGDIVRVGLYLKKEKGVVVKKTNGVIKRYVPPKLNDFVM